MERNWVSPNGLVKALAGHDPTYMKDIVPTVMLFVPRVDGISHNKHEYTHEEDIAAGTTMLTAVAERLCSGALNTDTPHESVSWPVHRGLYPTSSIGNTHVLPLTIHNGHDV
ncbi:M20/M25/M40 family metallo-hydrolase [Arthrobacter sp. KNU40]|uniref:M20/M25/M40 family metallo-hydrolase n=1 Tax=Arthrobacter sp. KNU40 TaxID=3447965 RepID=UPI003F645F36